VPFFLGDFVGEKGGKEVPLPICPRQVLKRVLKRAEKLGFTAMCGMEYEWFNFAETPQSWAEKKGVAPTTITPGMFGYSLLARQRESRFLRGADDSRWATSACRSRDSHRDGAGRLRGGDPVLGGARGRRSRILFKTGAKEIGSRFGIMPSFMAKWNQHLPGLLGHIISRCPTARRTFSTTRRARTA
jgi:glutamine synthetase